MKKTNSRRSGTPTFSGLLEKVTVHLQMNLTEKRFNHVMGVVELAGKLAKKHGLDAERARLAGALHDVARCWTDARLLRYVRTRRIKIPDLAFVTRYQPGLFHSYVGADIARRTFGITDPEILSAIEKHSLGSVRMSPFEKCIYLADLLAADRVFPEADALRELAYQDMDAAFREGIAVKIRYVVGRKEPVHPEVVKVWNAALAKES